MKKLIAILIITFSFIGCGSDESETEETSTPANTYDSTVVAGNSADSLQTIVNRPIIWTVDEQSSGEEILSKPANVKLDTFSSGDLVNLINKNYPDVHLDLLKTSHDTLYVKIPDSKKLTQEMGSTGAESYMAAATFTLTELKNIRFVNFDMQEGDHAGPGVYTRQDFKRFRKIIK